MSSQIFVRPIKADEWKAFSEIRLEALKNYPGVFASSYKAESIDTEMTWLDWLSQDGKCVFGLYDNNTLVGNIGIFTYKHDASGKTAIIGAVYIKPTYHSKGLSKLLYKASIDWGKHYLKWDKIIVSHRTDNMASRGAILQQRFVATHQEPMTWPNGETCDQIWYKLDLQELRKSNDNI